MSISNHGQSLSHQIDAPRNPAEALESTIGLIEKKDDPQAPFKTLFDVHSGACALDEFELFVNNDLSLFMTQADSAFNGITQDETGGVVWGAAVCMSQYLTKDMVYGLKTMELGCGGGAPSLVACKYGAKHVVATDFELGTLERMAQHAKRNNCPDLDISFLDWAHLPDEGDSGYHSADVVMASDVIYGAMNVKAFVQTIDYYLSKEGTFYFATRDGRQSVDKFLARLPQSGFVEEKRVPCVNDVDVVRWRGDHTIYIFRRRP